MGKKKFSSMKRKNLKKKNWNKNEVKIFLWVILYFCEKNGINPHEMVLILIFNN